MAPREFLLRYGPYRNIHAGEDEDLWRRLFADNAIIWLEHDRFFEEIKNYKNTFSKRLTRALDKKAGILQSGVSFVSCLQWAIESNNFVIKEWSLYFLAYPFYLFRESYELPPPFDEKRSLHKEIERNRMTLPEIESYLDQSFDRKNLSARGQDIFFDV
jgi:hypothetical protein